MTIRQRSYVRMQNGHPTRVPDARVWTAEDYDLIEELIELGLPFPYIRLAFTPTPSADAMRCAASRAGIKNRVGRGRPTAQTRSHWESTWRRWESGTL